MVRYRSASPLDDPSLTGGDEGFLGVDEFTTGENLPPGMVQSAVNVDFSSGDAKTRGGFVCIPSLGNAPFDAAATWTARTSAANSEWRGIVYGNGRFVAVASGAAGSNDVMYSFDAITWVAVSSGISRDWRAVTFGNGLFVAVANSGTGTRVMTSPDGITWTGRTSAADNDWRAVTWSSGASLFVAVARDGVTQQVMTSPNGTTWTIRSTPVSQSGHDWVGIASGNGVIVAVAETNGTSSAMYSSDGITWTAATTPGAATWSGIAFGNNAFVAVGTHSTPTTSAMTSTDGITWTARTTTGAAWTSVAYGNSLFVAIKNIGLVTADIVMSSPDGITWTDADSANTNAWQFVTNGNNTFVAVSSDGSGNRVMTWGATTSVWTSGVFSDPASIGSNYIMLVGRNSVGFYAFGRNSKTVAIDSAEEVTEQSTVVQANNKVYIFRGSSETPLVWDGHWANEFELATGNIPETNQAIYYQNRLWAIDGKDTLSASDVLDFTTWNNLDNSFNLGKGDSNYLVTTYPFGDTTITVFKNRQIVALTGVDGTLNDIVATEITRQVGAIGINAVCSVGPDLVYMSDRNINLLSLTQTNNALQHKTLPLSIPIKKIFDRVNWEYGYKVSMGYWDNKLYVALPLDNATVCNSVVVYNFITEKWYGEWNFDSSLGMAIQGWEVATYLGLQRLHAITEDGRIFVTDEGPQDISGTNVFEISSSLTTRPYRMDDNQKLTRRFWMDIGTWRPVFSVTAYSSGEGYSTSLVTDREYERTQTWKYQDSTYAATNANDDYNRPWRKDYAGYCSDNIQAQSGFNPNVEQKIRLPLTFRMKARLIHFTVENTQGTLSLNGVGLEATEGDRQSYAQVG